MGHPIDEVDDRVGERPALRHIVLALKFLHRLGERFAVDEVVGFAGDTEPLAQRRDAGVRHPDLQGGAGCDARAGLPGVAAHFGELRLERLVARLRRVEAVERRSDVGGVRDLVKHRGRFRGNLVVVDVGADAGEMHPPELGVSRIGEHRRRELEFSLG